MFNDDAQWIPNGCVGWVGEGMILWTIPLDGISPITRNLCMDGMQYSVANGAGKNVATLSSYCPHTMKTPDYANVFNI